MYTQCNTLKNNGFREAGQVVIAPAMLPATIEQIARVVFESFSNRLREKLNGRQQRALKLALGGHVTHKAGRIFSVQSENCSHSYLVNLECGTCTCPDYRNGNICKHRIAAYLIEQSLQTNRTSGPEAADIEPREGLQERVEIARQVLNARSQSLHEAIIYAKVPNNGDLQDVEVISIEGEVALVRALPRMQEDGKLVPCFPFVEGRSSAASVLSKSLVDITIFR